MYMTIVKHKVNLKQIPATKEFNDQEFLTW